MNKMSVFKCLMTGLFVTAANTIVSPAVPPAKENPSTDNIVHNTTQMQRYADEATKAWKEAWKQEIISENMQHVMMDARFAHNRSEVRYIQPFNIK